MKRTSWLLGAALSLAPLAADAHVSVASGPGFATTNQEIAFGVGHGCEGADTYSVRIEMPAGVQTTVLALTSDFGRTSVERDSGGFVKAVTWQKADEDLVESDYNYYKLVLRMKVPDQPFTTLYFPTHQVCKKKDGTLLSTEWTALPGESGEPAPGLKILPVRTPGWNKVTVPAAISDLKTYFSDAQIVWKSSAAYSANTATAAQIAETAGVTALTSLAAGDEIWVKY